MGALRNRGTLILAVAASDSHVVANHLIAHMLRSIGFTVVNLGACTTIWEISTAVREHPDVEAVLIGSLNGHAYEDLRELPDARRAGDIHCPVIVGGNLSVGSRKRAVDAERLYRLGVDYLLDDPEEIPALLDRLYWGRSAQAAREVS